MSSTHLQATPGVAGACDYRYDALGRLTHCHIADRSAWRFWRGARVANEVRTAGGVDTHVTWLRALGQPIVELVSGAMPRMTLLATAVSGSVLLEADAAVRTVAYAPHGSRPDSDEAGAAKAEPAFNGEPLDAGSGCYLLGAGHHRPYSPTLGMFLAPDSASPFGVGGLNGLSYCGGDPVNRTDPTGHFWKWVVAAIGIVAGVAAIAMSWGAASGAVTAVMAGGIAALSKSGAAAVAAVTLGVASVGVEAGAIAAGAAGDSKAAGILGWVGFGLGLVGMVPGIAKAAANGAAKLSRFSQRIGRIRTQGLSGRGALGAGRNMGRRGSVFQAPSTPSPNVARAPAASGKSRLVGYHGTSSANADRMLTNGAEGIYLTDNYASASHYAKVAGKGDPGVVLGMYADDVERVRAFAAPKANQKGISEVINEGSTLRAKVVGPGASPIDDFADFWTGRVVSGDSRAAAVRSLISPERMAELDAMYARMGM